MKRALLIILFLIALQPASFCANKKMVPTTSGGEDLLPNIFIYAIPDDENTEFNENLTEYKPHEETQNNNEVIMLEEGENSIALGATTLKGYAQFIEDDAVIHLKDDANNYVLNIKTPQKISGEKGLNITYTPKKQIQQYQDAEYKIAPNKVKTSEKAGDFTFGASYGNEVDNIAMLETETGLFTKYEKNRFALSSSFTKSLNTTFAQDYNTISVAPELKLNNYMSLKNVLSADITRNRRSTKLVFLLNPFGKHDKERFEFELGAKQTVYLDTDFTKTEFSFSTNFKL